MHRDRLVPILHRFGGEKAFEKADEVEIYPASTTVANIQVTNSAPGNGYSNSDTVVISSLLNGSGVTANVVTIANVILN